jgi:hypothetical protein
LVYFETGYGLVSYDESNSSGFSSEMFSSLEEAIDWLK